MPPPVPYEIRAATEELLARYAERIDAGDFEGVADLLAEAVITTEDGTVVAAGPSGVLAMYERFTRRHADGTPRTRHVITNLIVEPAEQPGRYVARSSFLVVQATESLPLQVVVVGRYRDIVETEADGGVHFVERCMVPTLSGDLREHLFVDPTG